MLILRGEKLIVYPTRQSQKGIWRAFGPARKLSKTEELAQAVETALETDDIVGVESSLELARMLGIKSWKQSYGSDKYLSGYVRGGELLLQNLVLAEDNANHLVEGSWSSSLVLPLVETQLRRALKDAFQQEFIVTVADA